MKPFFLAIEGPIGVGKTTLGRLLEPRFEAELLLEAFEENPFLSSFYGDRARYAFQTQMFFLLSRYRQQQSIPSLTADAPLIADYTFGKDSLFARLNLDGDELDMYQRLYRVLADQVALPDLVVYLRAETESLMVRIATRDRPYEREMDRDYIDSVRQAYKRYFSGYTSAPVLTVDTDDLNYVQDSSALAFVETQIRKSLGIGAYQEPLPQMLPAHGARATQKVGPMGHEPPGKDAIETFLAANEAVARVGAALGGSLPGSSRGATSDLRAALLDAMEGLHSVAQSAGLGLGEPRE
ncbi:MAG: deoxynucleoside kinase [Anaerolineae bacterium]|jgi:deoxyguanosine kinase